MKVLKSKELKFQTLLLIYLFILMKAWLSLKNFCTATQTTSYNFSFPFNHYYEAVKIQLSLRKPASNSKLIYHQKITKF